MCHFLLKFLYLHKDCFLSIKCTSNYYFYSFTADFSSVPAAVTIPSGQSSISFSIGIIDDAFPEPTESFDVRMTISSGQSVIVPSGADTATVTITDSDSMLLYLLVLVLV